MINFNIIISCFFLTIGATIESTVIENTLLNRHELPYQNWFIEKLFSEFNSNGDSQTVLMKDIEDLMDAMGIKYFPHPPHKNANIQLKDEYLECYEAVILGRIFGFNRTSEISMEKFKEISPALILMSTTHDCIHDHDHDRAIIESKEVKNYIRHQLPYQNWFIEKLFNEFNSNCDSQTVLIKDIKDLMDAMGIKYFPHGDHKNSNNQLRDEYLECYEAINLGKIFGFNNTSEISMDKFKEISPALILMSTTHDCIHDHDHENSKQECKSLGTRYLYGSITIIIISIISFLSVVLVGKFGKLKSTLTNCLTGLAFGTLLSDTMLHLLPAAVGLHDHSAELPTEDIHDHDHDHDHEHDHEHDMTYIWVFSVTIATIVILWLIETLIDAHGHNHGHGHSHSHETENGESKENGETKLEQLKIDNNVAIKQSGCGAALKNVQAKGWTMFFGDILHNITDGLAIAASFSQSPSLGFSTGLAILFHEIPHEIGAFIVLRKFGFGYIPAIISNAINGCISLIAFLIVTSVTGEPSIWLFAIIAGVFIHISLVDLLPELRNIFIENKKNKNLFQLFLIGFSSIIGWVIMLLLAIYEEDIDFDFGISC